MIDHDRSVGELLDLLDELEIADSTFVMYSTNSREAASLVPIIVRWPGKVPAGAVSNDRVSHRDWLPTILAMAGEPDIKQKLSGHAIGDQSFNVHIDGRNLLPLLTRKNVTSSRPSFIYFTDDGAVTCLRYDNGKQVFLERNCQGTTPVWGAVRDVAGLEALYGSV